MTKILISGGTGFIGKALVNELSSKGHDVWLLSRRKNQLKSYYWDPHNNEIDPGALTNTEIIIHLAGASVAGKRWTPAYKQEIYNSRIQSTRFLYQILKENKHQVHSFIAGSASGYYGYNSQEGIAEDSPAGNTFLAGVCKQWEAESLRMTELGIRTAIVRTGMVMGAEGGFLGSMKMPVNLGLAATLGPGNNWVPWISLEDISGIFSFLAQHNELSGIFNAASPEPVTQKVLVQTLANTMRRPYFLPGIPPFLLRLMLGPIAQEMLLSSKLSADKIQKAGYTFRYPRLSDCLAHALS